MDQTTSSSSRKRSRATTPTPSASGSTTGGAGAGPSSSSHLQHGGSTGGTRLLPESTDDTIRAQQLRDKNQRIKALNALLRLSIETTNTYYVFTGDSVVRELLKIAIYDCLSWPTNSVVLCSSNVSNSNQQTTLLQQHTTTNRRSSDGDNDNIADNDDHDDDDGSTVMPVFSSATAWIKPPTRHMEAWLQHCRVMLGGAGKLKREGGGGTRQEPEQEDCNIVMTREKFRVLDVIIAIIRNLSYVGANHRMLAYTPDVVALLIGCLYDDGTNEVCYGSGSGGDHGFDGSGSGGIQDYNSTITSNLAANAMQTLIHLSSYLDVSGQKLLADKLFYSPITAKDSGGPLVPYHATAFGQAANGSWGFGGLWLARRLDTKEDFVTDVSKEFLLSMTADYLVGIWSLFSALTWILTNPLSPRPVLLMAVDLLQEFINHARIGVVGSVDLNDKDDEIPSMRAILVNIPDTVLTRFVDFLYVPRLGPDALEYLDPVTNVVTRVTTLRLLMGYDATVDTDIRDRVLDLLVPLLELDSPRMAVRLGTETTTTTATTFSGGKTNDDDNIKSNFKPRMRLLDAIVPILKTSVGRNEAPLLASQLLRELSKAKENRIGLLCIQERLVELASNDNQRVSSVVWNHLYPPEQPPAAAASSSTAVAAAQQSATTSGYSEGESEVE